MNTLANVLLVIVSAILLLIIFADVSDGKHLTPKKPGPWQTAGVATWYGPGFYGNNTFCGQRYHINLPGVASNRLPCGTIVEMTYKGRTVKVPVNDTGGFSHTFDLSSWTARKLCACRKPYTIHNLKYRVYR